MSGSGFAQFIPLILIFVIFYFFLIRPQQKKVKEHKLMVSSLKRGYEVITSGGIVGRIEKAIFLSAERPPNLGEKSSISIIQQFFWKLLPKFK